MKSPNLGELDVSSLGPCRYPSPLRERSECVDEQTGRVLLPSDTTQLRAFEDAAEALPSFESAGPRSKLFFEPAGLRCGIVTCGGLCPGLNDVVRSVVLTLTYGYGVEQILGFRYGYAGLSSRQPHEPIQLTPRVVDTIHTQGGTILGSSRGSQDTGDMVDTLERLHISILFAHATLANSDVNFCLVPEVRFSIEGSGGFLHALVGRLERKHHAVVVVAEGSAQHLLPDPAPVNRDASGNVKPGDVGRFLRGRIATHLRDHGVENIIKYIDPSYLIRSLPANSRDSAFCLILGQHAVHAGMAGKTNMLVGFWNQRFTHVPIHVAVETRKRLNPNGEIWQRMLEATGQPAMVYDAVGIVLFSLMLVAITGEEPGQAVVRATVSVGGALPLGAAGALLLAPLAHRIRGASLRLSLILGSILLVVGAADALGVSD